LALDHKRDIFDAPYLLNKWENEYGTRPNVKVVKYEKLLSKPNFEIEQICNWLGIAYDPEMLSYSGNSDYIGKYGDPKVVRNRDAPQQENADKWKQELTTKGIKEYLHGYGAFLGNVFLKEYGYADSFKYRSNLKFKSFRYFCFRLQTVHNRSFKDYIISFLIRKIYM
jgi:hypothetical protein